MLMTISLVLMSIGVIYQISIGVMYVRMIKASESMTSGNNKLLKQCKDKFIQAYNLNGGVNNIPVFVDKYINRIHIMGMSINFVKHLSGQLMLAGVFAAGLGVCKGIIDGTRFMDLIPFYIVSLFGIYLFVSISSIVDMQGRKQALKTNLVDYLENHVARRLENGIAFNEQEKTAPEQEEPKKKDLFTKDDAKELEDLLKSLIV